MAPLFESASTPFDLTIADSVSGRGGSSCNITDSNGQPLVFQIGTLQQPLQSPFGAGVFGDAAANEKATRLNLDFDVSQRADLQQKFEALDAQVLQWLEQNKDKFKVKSIEEAYKPCLIDDDKYGTRRFRTKLNTAGLNSAKAWDAKTKERIPDVKAINFRECPCVAHIQISKIWCMAKQIGITRECKSAVITQAEEAFPLDME